MSVVELNAVTGVWQYLGYETLELQQFFLGHVMFLLNDQRNAARVEHGRAAPAFAIYEGNRSNTRGEASEETFSCAHSRYAMRRDDLQCV